MKKLSIYIFLVLIFCNVGSANDIREFEIEGMSIGDSALDYFSEGELKKANDESYKDKKFMILAMWKEYKIYDVLQIYVKPNDTKYKIYAIGGVIVYSDNLKDCYKKKDKIVDDLSKDFKDLEKIDNGRIKNSVEADPYGGTYDSVIFNFMSGDVIQVSCNDWSNKSRIVDSVKVEVYSKEVKNYLITKN